MEGTDANAPDALLARLRESEQQLRFALQGGDLGLWDWRVPTGQLLVNDRWLTMLGLDPAEGSPGIDGWHSRVHPDDAAQLQHLFETVILNPAGDAFEAEIRARHADGRYVWILDRGAVVERGPDGAPLRVVGTHMDITARMEAEIARREAEDALRAREARLRRVIEAAPVPFLLFSPSGEVEYLNPAFVATFGYTPEDLGTIDDFCDRAFARGAPSARLPAAWIRELKGERAPTVPRDGLELLVRARDGTERVVIAQIAMLDERGPRVPRLLVLQDVTDQRALERAVLVAIGAEQQRFGMDLHDGLGQELTGLKFFLAALAQQPPADPVELRQQLDKLAELAAHCVGTARAMARGLAPLDVDAGDLVTGLRELARSVRDSGALEVTVVARGFPMHGAGVGASVASNAYRIVQEALNNAVRHGRATRATVTVTLARSRLRIVIQDDGRGFRACDAKHGMGLRTMRYRAHALRGRLDITSGAGGGTCVRLSCPVEVEVPAATRAG
jgi:PAS domain S-box-containing protein